MKKYISCLTLLCIIFNSNSFATNYFWIGGSGNWNDVSHWSLSSGGAATFTSPSSTLDNVNFDANSGLSAISTVNLNTAITVHNFDFSAVPNAFSFNSSTISSVEISGDLVSNGSAIFSSAITTINMKPTLLSNLTSNGTIWTADFHLQGTNTLTLTDNFSSTKSLFLESGVFNAPSISIQTLNFNSNYTSIRTINLSNSAYTITGTSFYIDSTTLIFSHTGAKINFSNSGASTFRGGSLIYDTVNSTNGTLTIYGNNKFNLLNITSATPSISLDNGSTQQFTSLTNSGSCLSKAVLRAINLTGAPAVIIKAGPKTFTGSNLSIRNVNASSPSAQVYNVSTSDTLNGSTGWNYVGKKYYWIGNGGNWTNVNHWSTTSNGSPSGCLPQQIDSVVFDANSFTSASQVVVVDADAYFTSMNWAGALYAPTFRLTYDVFAFGDVTLNTNMSITKDSLFQRIEFRNQSIFNPDSASIDCNLSIRMDNAANSLLLGGYLRFTDSTALYHSKGKFYSQGERIDGGSIQVVDTSLSSIKLMDLGASSVNLSNGFTSEDVSSNFTFNAQTSTLYIGSKKYKKFLLTNGLAFNNVTLYFPRLVLKQRITGNNSFKKLKILAGSNVHFETGTTQTIVDSLILKGNCSDSIYISSTNPLVQAEFSKSSGNVTAECTNFSAIKGKGGATYTAYFSKNVTNTNWIFNATKPVRAGYTAVGPFCYGNTTVFTNTSTCFSGNPADFTTKWYYGDGSTGYFANPPTDSTWINYEVDTLKHRFETFGKIPVKIVAIYKNFCTDTLVDTVKILYPNLSVSLSKSDTTICSGSPISFNLSSNETNVLFQAFVNGVAQNNPATSNTIFTTNTLSNLDTVSFKCFQSGCIGSSIPKFGVKVRSLPIINWTSSDADTSICLNDVVSFTASGGATYQYFKNGTAVTTYIPSGIYTTASLADNDAIRVLGKDTATGCIDTLNSRIFNVNPLPTTVLSSSIVGNLICIGDLVTFTASGANQYKFYLNGVAVTGFSTAASWSIDTLKPTDIVSVEGKSIYGCSKFAAETFSYIVNPLPTSDLLISDADTSICSGTIVTFTAGGGSMYEYFINGVSQGASSVSTLSSATLANNDEIYVRTSFSGCSNNSDTVKFEVLTAPTTSLTSSDADNSICSQTSVTFTASGATTYEFFVNGVSKGAASATTTFTTTTLANGNIISVKGISNTCPVTASLTFTVLNIPIVPLFSNDADNTICHGDPITLSSANSTSYELFLNNVSQGPAQAGSTFSPALAVGSNVMYVKGTGANGCSVNSSNLTVKVNAIPTVVLTSSDADNIICVNEPVTFTGSGSANYQFFINGSSQGNMSTTNQLTTTNLSNNQTISIVGSTLGCSSTSNTLTYTVNAIPSVTLNSTDPNNIFCAGDVVTYTAGGATNYEYFINNVSQGAASVATTLNASSFLPGSYVVKVIGTANNCSSFASNSVVVNSIPTVTIAASDLDNTICTGESISYTVGGASLYDFKINNISIGVPTPLTLKTISTLVNADVVSVVGTSSQGCVASASISPVTVNASPSITLSSSDGDNIICKGDLVTFTASGASSYEFFNNGVSQGAASGAATLPTTSLNDGDQVTVKGFLLGCSANSSAIATVVHAFPIVTLSSNAGTQICAGDNTSITAIGANQYQFLINNNPTGPYSSTNTYTGTVNNGDVVTVKGQTFGCISNGTSNLVYSVNNYPTLVASSSDANNDICLDEQVTFTGSGAQTYVFDINGKQVQSGATTTYTLSTLEDGDVVSVKGFNGTCASSPSNFTFVVHSMPLNLKASTLTSICNGDAVTFTASGADQYQFFVNGVSQGPLSSTATFNKSNISNLDKITFTGYSSTTQCTQDYKNFILMNVSQQPVITASPTNLNFCETDSVILYSNSNYGNQWLLNGAPIVGATDTAYVVHTSGNYSLAVTHGDNGGVWSFGLNAQGIFGDSTNFNNAIATRIASTLNFDEISTGSGFVLGVTTSGTVYAWGENTSGQLGTGLYTGSNYPIIVPTLNNIKTVATSETSAMAVTLSGGVYVWGNNNVGQLATGNTSVINFPYLNTQLTNVDTIAAGKNHFIFLKTDGTVWAVGNNDYGQLGKGDLIGSNSALQISGLSSIVTIGAGEYQSYAIDNSGKLYVWGDNTSGQLGLNDLISRLIPTLSPLSKVVKVQGGAKHSLFLTSEQRVYAAGNNAYGQLGTGDNTPRLIPVKLALYGVDMISAGQYTSLFKRTDNQVYGAGNNLENQLSTLATTSVNTISLLPNLYNTSFIEAGVSSSHFILDGETSCTSSVVTLSSLTAPQAVITRTGMDLIANTGVSYQWYIDGSIIPGANTVSVPLTANGYYTVKVTYASGCSSTSASYAYGVVGIEELTSSFTVYPNPTNGVVTVTISSIENLNGVTLLVKDLSGRVMKSEQPSELSKFNVDLTNYAMGMYHIELLSNEKVVYRTKVLKSNF